MANRRVFHTKSSVATIPQFDLWGLPPTQVSVEEDVVTEYYPVAPVSDNSPLEFVFKTGVDEYLNFNEMYLYLKCQAKLHKGTGNLSFTDWDKVKPVQYLLHSMFNKVDVTIGGKVVTQSPQLYHYKSYLEALLSFSDDAKKSYMSASLWTKQDKDRTKVIKAATPTDENGKEFEMMGRLHLDFTYTGKFLIGGVEVRIKLNREDPKFFINTEDPSKKPEIIIKEAVLVVHKSKATRMLLEGHQAAHAVAPCVYPITRSEMTFKTILNGSQDAPLDNILIGEMPRRMFVMLVSATAFNGNYGKDPYKFDHYNVSQMSAFIDGTQYPKQAYAPNFDADMYTKVYMGLYQALNQNLTDSHAQISYEEFKNNNSIFAFNFSPDLSDGPGMAGHVSPKQEGTLRLYIRFKNALPEAINVLMYMEFDSYIEIHQNRAVTTSYN